jgi:hypothetical protein
MGNMEGFCSICGVFDEVRHLPIYVRGSEGVSFCHDCEMLLVDFIKNLMNLSGRIKKEEALRRKQRKEIT